MPSNDAAEVTGRFVGEIIDDEGVALVRDLFDPERPPLPPADAAAVPAAGSVVAARSRSEQGVAAIDQILAPAGSARAQLYRVAAAAELDPLFPGEVEAEVQHWLAHPGWDDPELEDLEAMPFVTIDDEHTRDLDQALYLAASADGYEAFYALADASYYVRPGSALFDEALRRGASYYLPDLVIPMLPRALSEGLVSLNPKVPRRALVFQIQLDRAGQVTGTLLRRGRIRSRAKLSFNEVQGCYDRPTPGRFEPAVAQSLELLRELGEVRIQLGEQRHLVQYRRTEVDVGLAEPQGMRFVAIAEHRLPVERYNEQLSLLCNTEGARLLQQGATPGGLVQPIYRVHPQPEPERIAEFEALTQVLARAHGKPAAAWAWQAEDGTSLAAYLARLPTLGTDGRLARAIHRQAILLNVRSSFSESAAGHYGVGAEVYARFSSPMREVVGIFVHKEAWEKTTGRPLGLPPAPVNTAASLSQVDDDQLRSLVVDAANRAKEVQKRLDKETNRLVLDQILGEDLARPPSARPQRRGTVMGLTRSKAHVLLDEPPIEVKAYLAHLEEQRGLPLAIDEHAVELGPADGPPICMLGDAVDIQVRGQERRRGQQRWVLGLQRAG